mmetsp:Transcript_30569/g.58928  ORF Transcript_30569/g.58928 Transcript_30569/m.58928 type:complete len:155 (-) Transcript_30569:347-811(-)
MSLTAEEKLEANLNVLQRLKRPISTETSGECLRHNVLRVPLQELVLRTEMCSVCLAQVSVEAIIKADNALPCPGMLKGNKCDQVHGYSFCREIMYSQDVGPLRHCIQCRKCVGKNTIHCMRCNRCYVKPTTRFDSACPCSQGEEEIFDDGCDLC